MNVSLGYGRAPLAVALPDRTEVLSLPPAPAPPKPLAELLAQALAEPVGTPRLRGRVAAGAAVTIIISDGTRAEPREAMVQAVLEEIGVPVDLTVAVANGTHAPRAESLPWPRVWNHDSEPTSPTFVSAGTTRRGTVVRLPRFVFDSSLIVATGRIRPHYFAGYGAGAKAIFPGLGRRDDIRQNHLLKSEPTSRLGRVDGNACRDDIEEAVALLRVPTFLLNVVAGDRGVFSAVAGDLVHAHRVGVEACRSTCEVRARKADVVVVSDKLPVSGSLYQASKLLAPAGLLLRPGGTVILAAECFEGTGPLQVVNEGIYRIGIRHFFPEDHRIILVSSMSAEVVSSTYCRYAPSVEAALSSCPPDARILAIPFAGSLVPVALD
jgi:lactate racemase